MKRLFPLALLLICLVFALAACGGSETTTAEGDLTTPAGETTQAPADSTPVETTSPKTDVTTPAIDPDVEPIVTDDYTAIPNKFEWVSSDDIDYSKFDYSGTGAQVVSTLDSKYNGYKKTWYPRCCHHSGHDRFRTEYLQHSV